MTKPRADCSECRTELVARNPPFEPCPSCGSRSRDGFAYAEVATGTATVHSPAAISREPDPAYHHGRVSHHPARERRVGLTRSSGGVERLRVREYDRVGDRYEETVTDPDATVVHHEAGKLSDHHRP